ncbi:MAG: ERCC4 domain-containing protein [Pseudomonadota bacterium]
MVKILIDTREQLPYQFQTESETVTLPTGDYSLEGGEELIAIERKSVDDLIGCLTTGRDRFERELHRGGALDYFALIVEASLSDLSNGKYRSKMLPKAAIQSLLTFSIRYNLPVFFVENRRYGARVTESLLLKYAREQEKRFKAINLNESRR